MENNLFLTEMIRSELSEIVGPDFVSVAESDKFIYSTDWAWMPQMWLDRGSRSDRPITLSIRVRPKRSPRFWRSPTSIVSPSYPGEADQAHKGRAAHFRRHPDRYETHGQDHRHR